MIRSFSHLKFSIPTVVSLHKISQSLSLSLSHTHTHTHTHTNTVSVSFFCLSLSLSHSRTHSQPHTLTAVLVISSFDTKEHSCEKKSEVFLLFFDKGEEVACFVFLRGRNQEVLICFISLQHFSLRKSRKSSGSISA